MIRKKWLKRFLKSGDNEKRLKNAVCDICSFLRCCVFHSSSRTAQLLSRVRPFATPWTVPCQAPLFMGFPRQEYWTGLPFSSPAFNRHMNK